MFWWVGPRFVPISFVSLVVHTGRRHSSTWATHHTSMTMIDLLRLEEKHREKSEGPIHKEWIPAAECPINCASLSTSICPSQGQIHKGYYSGFFTALLQSKHAAEVWQLCASKIAIIYVEKYRWFFYFFSRWGVKAFLENFRQWNKICGEKIYKCVASVTTNSQKMLINYL